jgi:FKBP-type peptidyl-prolyl cis-trans isomerase
MEGVEKLIKGAIFTESGLAYRILEKGSGPKPNIDSTVEVHYVGRLLDGIEFDSSVKRGVPTQFGVSQVISGWTEVLQLMPEGSKWKVYIPAEMAYGSSGAGGVIGPNQDLIFEIELIQSNVD